MQFNPPDIRRKTFQLMRRGFDPQEVGAYLEQLSAHVADLQQRATAAESTAAGMERELEDAKSAEEAVRLTMMAATQAKEEILTTAQKEADELRSSAEREVKEMRSRATEDADRVLNEARREALTTLESSRRDAEEMVAAARAEHEGLLAETTTLRHAIDHARGALTALASGALHELASLDSSLLGNADGENRPPISVVPPLETAESATDAALASDHPDLDLIEDEGGDVVLLPDAVDRLLTQLRDINP